MASSQEQTLPVWRLFNISYHVSVPDMFFYGKERVAHYGRPTSGNKSVDQSMMGNHRQVMIPVCTNDKKNILGIDHYYALGADIIFYNIDDAALIYKDIIEHLQDWETYLKNDLHGASDAPIDDLILLDELKNSMFVLTQRAEDPLALPSTRSKLKRTFTRQRSMFNNEYHQDEETLKEDFSSSGDHIFRAMQYGDTSEEVTEKSMAQQATDIRTHMRKLPDGGVKDFSSFFEQYRVKQQGGDLWAD